jgi:hypothetical protein
MASPVAPMLALTGISYANNWYNTGNALDVKPLLFGGVATAILAGFGAIPGAEKIATAIAWLALTGFFLAPVQNPSPAENLLKITGNGNAKKK